jgi:hypothetical protein
MKPRRIAAITPVKAAAQSDMRRVMEEGKTGLRAFQAWTGNNDRHPY